nr:glycosyltransferase family 4 protein [Ectobacillus ponti]
MFYIPSGGIETLNRQRCKALMDAGITCHLLYFRPGSGMQNVYNIPTFIMDQDEAMQKLLQEQQYDAIIISSAYEYMERLRSLGYGGLLFWEVQGYALREEALFAFSNAQPIVARCGNGVLYPKTPYIMKLAEQFFPPEQRFCFHNCMNFADFGYVSLPKEPRPVLGWVGRIEANKNWQDFLKIGSKLRETCPNLQLWMFEDPSLSTAQERRLFTRMVQELNLEHHVTMHMNISHAEMPKYYSRIGDSGGLLCSTSKLEGFGYAVLEAMACRCPVLATESEGISSFLLPDQTGKVYPHGNIGEAARMANMIMTDQGLRRRLSDQALQHVQSLFSPAQYSQNFINMLNSSSA